MAKIIGNTTATPNPRPDWNQTDETKADYIKNKPVIEGVWDHIIDDSYLVMQEFIEDDVTYKYGILDKDPFYNKEGRILVAFTAPFEISENLTEFNANFATYIKATSEIDLRETTITGHSGCTIENIRISNIVDFGKVINCGGYITNAETVVGGYGRVKDSSNISNFSANPYVGYAGIIAENCENLDNIRVNMRNDDLGGDIFVNCIHLSNIHVDVECTQGQDFGKETTCSIFNQCSYISGVHIGAYPILWNGAEYYKDCIRVDADTCDGYTRDSDETVATEDYVDAAIANLDSNFVRSDASSVEFGHQMTAKGEASSAFGYGLVATESGVEILGQQYNGADIIGNGVAIKSVNTSKNTITIEHALLGLFFDYVWKGNSNFVLELDKSIYLPIINTAITKSSLGIDNGAEFTVHKNYSVAELSSANKITNAYCGIALGKGSVIANNYSNAMNQGGFASGSANHAIGFNSHTQNVNNIASGDNSSAAGSNTEAGNTAFSTGHRTKALGEASFTLGIGSETLETIYGEDGKATREGGKGSIAGGYEAKANAPYSAAFGISTQTDAEGQFVCGKANATDASALFIVGAGNCKNALSVGAQKSKFLGSLSVGTEETAVSGDCGAVATGHRTKAAAQASLTFGIGSETADSTVGEGGKGSIAGGYQAKANAPYSGTIGFETTSDRRGQFTCGDFNDADANALFVVGNGTTTVDRHNAFTVDKDGVGRFGGAVFSNGVQLATVNDITDSGALVGGEGTGAIKMGDRTTAYANYSFAGGETSTTKEGAKACLAFGISAEARAVATTALGWRTIANADNELVVGRCNNYEGWNNALFVVGNGTSDTARSNALVVNGNGDTFIGGDVYSRNKKLATEEWVASQNATTGNGVVAHNFKYEDYNVPVISLTGDISTMNKDNKVTLDYKYGDRTGTCTVKWQGNSSLTYPKKNYTVVFDNAFEAVEGWGVQKKYCLKADWVDFSHCRNVVSAKLWGDIVRTRTESDLTSRLTTLPNCGAIDGFPCFVVINGEWKGIYNFNIPKEDFMLGMGSGDKEAIVCAEGTSFTSAEAFKEPAVLGQHFELEYNSSGWAESDVQESLNRLIDACRNSDGTNIDTVIAQYVDIDSAIDYYIFYQLLNHADGIVKNYILATYDGTKWFFSAYDLDLVFGVHWPADIFDAANYPVDLHNCHILFKLLYENKYDQIKARYQALVNGVMSKKAVDCKFSNYGTAIPLAAYNADAELWPGIPSTKTNNLAQISNWYGERIKWLDEWYAERDAIQGTPGLIYDANSRAVIGMGTCMESEIKIGTLRQPIPLIIGMAQEAFKGETALEKVTIPEGIEQVGSFCFQNCTSLKHASFPSTCNQIGWGCFRGATGLKTVKTLNNTKRVLSVGSYAFDNCTSLVKISLGKNITIGQQTFYKCTSLKDIIFEGTMAEWEAVTKGENWDQDTGDYTVHCIDGDIVKA